MEKDMKEQLRKLVLEHGLRPLVNALAEVVEEEDGLKLYPDDDEPLDEGDRDIVAENIRGDLF
jgi:hypothetical protein